jgi:hypothetical protein
MSERSLNMWQVRCQPCFFNNRVALATYSPISLKVPTLSCSSEMVIGAGGLQGLCVALVGPGPVPYAIEANPPSTNWVNSAVSLSLLG